MARFTPNARGIAALARTREMDRYLEGIARQGAADVAANAPGIVRHAGARIDGEARDGVGRFFVDSPFWHLPEYGATRYPMRPYIRPAAQRLFARLGGRFVGR